MTVRMYHEGDTCLPRGQKITEDYGFLRGHVVVKSLSEISSAREYGK